MSAALPAEVRDLLDAILAAIDIPYPATVGDAVRHQEILAERVMHTTITLRQVLARQGTQFPADLPWETAYLREQLAIHPPTGYRTGPWPGKPVETAQQGTQGGDPSMTQPACLFCCRPIAPGEPRCPALEQGEVAAHQRCCGCQCWAGWTRPGPIGTHRGGLLMATGSRHDGLTTTETRLVEQYVSVLDYVSRCALAIDHGDWFYLYDKAGTLAEEAERLAELAREAYDAPRRPRKAAVQAAVAWFGRHYRAARLLHPLDPKGVSGHEAAPARHPSRDYRGAAAAAGLLRGGRGVPPVSGPAAQPAGPGLPRPRPAACSPCRPRRPRRRQLGGSVMRASVPWIGLAAIAAMFLLPWLDARGLFDGPSIVRRRPRRVICADCASPWTPGHQCVGWLEVAVREPVVPLRPLPPPPPQPQHVDLFRLERPTLSPRRRRS